MERLKRLCRENLKFLGVGKALLLILLFLFSRFFKLTRLPIFCDEAIYIRWAQIAWHDASQRFISLTDGKQPLQTWLTIPFLKVIDDPLAASRAMAGTAGFFLFLIAFFCSAVFFKKKEAGFWTAVLFLVTPYLVFFDRMALAESLLALFGLGAIFFSYLLATTRRLDVALLAGIWLGFGLLVKSSAFFFLFLFPLGIIFIVKKNWQGRNIKELKKFALLFVVVLIVALAIYNVQRLSPWMHIIGQKNKTFALPLSQAIREPKRLIYNFSLAIGWFWAYLTPPIFLASLVGLFWLLKEDIRRGLFLLGWLLFPLLGESLIAKIFTSRYLVFLVPVFLLGTAYFLLRLRGLLKREKRRLFLGLAMLILIWPLWRDYQLIFVPEKFPFTKTDRGYLEGWTAGYGVAEVAERVNKDLSLEKRVTVGTEGTFGLLPQGLEIYFDGREGVSIVGYYPLPDLPPENLLKKAQGGEKTYFMINNTPGDFNSPYMKLVAEYPKVNNSGSLRLYEVVAEK